MFLEKIVQAKREEIQVKKTPSRQREMEKKIPSLPLPRDFLDSLSRHAPMAVIAEIKRASPSLGMINEHADLIQFAREYEKGEAAAISVLTETQFFKGDLAYLQQVKVAVSLPVLQKDFILDPFQIYEGRISGADAVLLIAAILERQEVNDFVDLARSLGMTPLVEVHNENDLEKISGLDLPLIGINNRDLKTFEVDIKTTLRLKQKMPYGIKVISESGIKTSQDVHLLKEAGINGILIGEILMRSQDPAAKIKELLAGC